MRLFVAVEIPEQVRNAVADAAAAIGIKGLRLVHRDNIHFTLAFLGDVSEEKAESIKSAMEKTTVIEAGAEITGFGFFGQRVMFAKLVSGVTEMEGTAASLKKCLADEGVPFDDRKFVPHATVGRIGSAVDLAVLDSIIRPYENRSFGFFRFRNIALFRSYLKPYGPEYVKLYEK